MSDYPSLSIPSLFNVQGKIAVVTGGGSGIGTMIASALVLNGAKVYIASRKEKQLKEVSDQLNKAGPGSCDYLVADISSQAGCQKLVDAIKAKESKIHILVNNSGATWGAPYDNFPEKEGWDKILALNVKSIFYLTSGFTDLLAKGSTNADPRRVINISSIAGLSPVAEGSRVAAPGTGLWSYNTSKAAVNHLTSQLAVTLAPKYITVNAILPGVFPSKMTAFGFKKVGGSDKMASGHPFGRVGEPRDMAGVALFLTSPAAAYVTGAHIVVDGGGLVSGAKAHL
ncbi:rhamnolipids biosynthesis 3-oxoacyl-reductase [Stereum hirsutum FP-91666 SS1]|uniref:rhamnolipids biosynthesis 3-oxoacyl-reductase n=1 Tax=Stereum hirsutum (strain FP-91666) TaxID=721885 RepID=UPI000440ECC0|nr:rhamnolipids biosynthesis 3-oxoacyl-reductase [Stereum hirsutum FP-91666 SS1]EIM87448.1 rhamnolipids biosynthesis 3-oxoacyl-reductase [Stereum hirsutum FP-91666 SS1]